MTVTDDEGPLAPEPPTIDDLGGWPLVLGSLTGGGDLGFDQARAAMTSILAGEASPARVAGLIVALRMKGETATELSGLLAAMRDAAASVTLGDLDDADGVIDIVGTGGDRGHTINVSTLAAITAAGAGARVCKHGNRAASSACGTADVLEALGVAIEIGPEGVARCVHEAGIGFCFAPRYHPAMRHAGPTRKELGVPTVFNLLGPLANPAGVRRYVIGVAEAGTAHRVAGALLAAGCRRALVVHGGDGLDEITTTTRSNVVEVADGELADIVVDPAELGLGPATLEDLRGGDAATNADLARRVLAGEPGPHRDIVVLNAAAGLLVAGQVTDMAGGVQAARASLDGGAAAGALDRLVATSRAAAGGA